MVEDQSAVTIYTDGAAEPNPGPGGYGVILLAGTHRKELSAGYQLTTNNRMELVAVIVALETLTRPCRVIVCSDSKYVVDAIKRGSVFRWRSNGWRRTRAEKAKNSDLWKRFLVSYEKHSVTLKWVPGHRGIAANERCDQLAVAAAKSENLLRDVGYEGSTGAADTGARSSTESMHAHMRPGEPCRKCGAALIKKTPKRKKFKPGQSYYYEWYLYCPRCKAMYMVEAARRQRDATGAML